VIDSSDAILKRYVPFYKYMTPKPTKPRKSKMFSMKVTDEERAMLHKYAQSKNTTAAKAILELVKTQVKP
jgi:hypothetical protein